MHIFAPLVVVLLPSTPAHSFKRQGRAGRRGRRDQLQRLATRREPASSPLSPAKFTHSI